MREDDLPRWRLRDGAWCAEAGERAVALRELSIVTFNVWFGDHAFAQRATGLFGVLRASAADVIALQEVTQPFLTRLLAEPWVRERYWLSDIGGSTFSGYGVVLLSRVPVRRLWQLELPSNMDRKLLVAELGGITVATVHLESINSYVQERIEQMAVIFDALEHTDDVVLMGDMNFDTGTDENRCIDPRYRDLWPALRPDHPGWTMDNAVNTMRAALGKNPVPARFDRILLRGEWQGRAVELLGTEPLAPQVHPSDHFGLYAVLERPRA